MKLKLVHQVQLFIYFLVFCIPTLCFSQSSKIEKLEQQLEQNLSDTARIRVLSELSKQYTTIDSDIKIKYARKFIKIAQKLEIDTIVVEGYIDIGIGFSNLSKMDSTLYYLDLAYKKAVKENYRTGLGRTLVCQGYAYDKLDNDTEAIQKYLEAIEIFKKLKNITGLNRTYTNIGSLYFDMGKFAIAETYFKKAYLSFKKAKDEIGIGYSAFTLGNVYKKLEKFEKSKHYFNESLSIRQELGDVNGLALVRWGLGSLLIEQGQYQLGIIDLEIALQLNEQIKNDFQASSVLISLARAHYGLKDFKTAERNAEKALKMANKIGSKVTEIEAYNILITISKAQKNIPKAFEYLERLTNLSDSLRLENKLNEFTFSQFRKATSDNENLEKENSTILLKNGTYIKTIYLILGLMLFLIVLIVVIYKTSRQRKATNIILVNQKDEISTINKELAILNTNLKKQMDVVAFQNIELDRLNNVKNQFFSVVSHDLRSPMANLKILLNLYNNAKMETEDLNVLFTDVETNIIETSAFLDNLLSWAKSQLDGIVIKPQSFDVAALIQENLKIAKTAISRKQLRVDLNFSEGSDAFADKNMIDVVFRNLISNAIKFCNEGDSISISSKASTEHVEIIFTDTGIGIDATEKERLFELEHIITTGTTGETGHNIGLVLCKEMVEQNKGTIKVESAIGKGSSFIIILPKSYILS